jgi:hypothetical protein
VQLPVILHGTSQFLEPVLPAPYTTSGGLTAAFILIYADCPALIVGNHTLVEPFGMMVVYAFVTPTNASSTRPEVYVFETVVTDDAIWQALNAYGWPAQLGAVRIQVQDGITHADASSKDLEYRTTVARGAPISDTTNRHQWIWHGGPPDGVTILYDNTESVDESLVEPVMFQAAGGVLGQVLPGGVWVGESGLVQTTFSLRFP